MDENTDERNYEKQAQDFLTKTGTTFEATLIGHHAYFDEDTQSRDVYEIVLTREGFSRWAFKFGQSIVNSGRSLENLPYRPDERLPREAAQAYNSGKQGIVNGYLIRHNLGVVRKIRTAPTPYDVLACLTNYPPGSFKDFCLDYGYDQDSIKAQGVYFRVLKEWDSVNRIFGDVLDELREIQ